jgi:radical SAM-linked protein
MDSLPQDEPKVRQRVRIRFCKRGDLRLVGHRDLARLLQRLFRRAAVVLAMSEGFHPKPRMSFPSALALGMEGLDEVMEVELARPYGADDLLSQLRAETVPGLGFQSVELLPPGPKLQKARLGSVTYQIAIPAGRRADAATGVERLLARPACSIARAGRDEPLALSDSLESLALDAGVLSMRFRVTGRAGPGPRDLLAALGLDDLERRGECLRRTAVEVLP